MYAKHYNLKTKPFQISSDPAFLWLGDKHKEALATLKYGVLDNKGFMLLTGDVGTGKTTLINALIQSLSEDILYASVTDPRLELMDFLNYIAMAFGIRGDFETKGKFLLYFRKYLEDAYDQGKKVLLLIDEAQLLTQDLLEEIRLLSNIQKDGNNLLNIFFVGQNEFNEILERPENRAVAQRLTLNYHLAPLSPKETAEYIRYRLYVAGTRKELFEPEAVHQVHVYSGGFPRRINIICDHCLLNGYVKEKKKIDAAIVRSCAQDLKIPKYRKNKIMPPQRPIPPDVKQVPRPQTSSRPQEPRTPKGVARREKRSPVWSVAVMIFLGLLTFLYFLSPATFTAMYDGVEKILVSGMEKIEGQKSDMPIAEVPDSSAAEQEDSVPEMTPEKAASKPEGDDQLRNSAVLPVSENPVPVGGMENSLTDQSSQPPPMAVEQAEELSEADAPKQSRVKTNSLDVVSEMVEPTEKKAEGNPAESPAEGGQALSRERQTEREVPQPGQDIPLADEVSNPLPDNTVMVRFDPDSSDFYFADIKHVDSFVDAIKQHPKATVVISGHTDSYGSESYNYKLSLFRANMLKSFFLGKGIQPEKLVVKGFGSTQPIATNDTPEGRRLNRRVEIDIIR